MPFVSEVRIDTVPGILEGREIFARVTADIGFTRLERELGLSYRVKIALYHIDGQMDVYSVQPNWESTFLQREARSRPGGKDEFIAFSPSIEINNNDAARQTVSHGFDGIEAVPSRFGEVVRLKALVVCTPETATAMKWSDNRDVPIQRR